MEEELAKLNTVENELDSLNERVNWLQDKESERQEQNLNNELGIYINQSNNQPTYSSNDGSQSNKRKHLEGTEMNKEDIPNQTIKQYLAAMVNRMDFFEAELRKTKNNQQ